MRVQLSDQKRADMFAYWFKWSGHWVYDLRAKALQVWRERGIVNLPDYTEGAGKLLQPWVEADALPALIAKWNAERAVAA